MHTGTPKIQQMKNVFWKNYIKYIVS